MDEIRRAIEDRDWNRYVELCADQGIKPSFGYGFTPLEDDRDGGLASVTSSNYASNAAPSDDTDYEREDPAREQITGIGARSMALSGHLTIRLPNYDWLPSDTKGMRKYIRDILRGNPADVRVKEEARILRGERAYDLMGRINRLRGMAGRAPLHWQDTGRGFRPAKVGLTGLNGKKSHEKNNGYDDKAKH